VSDGLLFGVASAALLACCAMCLYRIGRGPTPPDRAMAIDILGIVVVCFTVIMALRTGKDYYLNIGIAWSILSFIGVIALAKHLEGRGFDE
jgi:multicomponent Na+:H+ antiporter subunit F